MTTDIAFQKELNEKLKKGVSIIAEAVGTSLGPKGRTAIIKQKDRKPFITKDGITIAKSIVLKDQFENLGAQILRQASETTLSSAGDGTSTSMVIANEIYQKAQTYLVGGDSPIELKKGIELASKKILEIIKEKSKSVDSLEEIEQIATVSANGDKVIGKLISVAVDKIGRDGSITIQEGRSSETTLDLLEGFTFDSGILANAFITDERRNVCRYEDCLVLVTEQNINTIEDIWPALEIISRNTKPLVIIADQIEGQALAALIMNKAKGTMKVVGIKAPKYGEERRLALEDIATITGASFFSRENIKNIKEIKLTDFGTAKIIETNKTSTTIVSNGQNQSQINERIDILREQIKNIENLQEAAKIQERITRLGSGIAVIKVGAPTEIEMIEKKHRIEDALEAVNAAQQEGIVCGGGTAFLRASNNLIIETENEEQKHGVEIVKYAVQAPFRKMIKNAGLSPDVCLENVLEAPNLWGFGYDVSTGNVCDLYEKGIIDPYRVIRCALENAVSAATTLLTTSVAIIEN